MDSFADLLMKPAKTQFRIMTTHPEHIEDFFINESSQQFSDDVLNFLNNGLKFIPKPKEPPILDKVAEIETSIKYTFQLWIRKI
jgi:hypothetical protein